MSRLIGPGRMTGRLTLVRPIDLAGPGRFVPLNLQLIRLVAISVRGLRPPAMTISCGWQRGWIET